MKKNKGFATVIPESVPIQQDQPDFRWLSSSLFLLNLSCWKPLLLSSKRFLLLFSLLLLLSLSGCRALREDKDPPHTFSRPLVEYPHPEFQKLFLFHTLWKILLYQLPPSASAPPHFSSPSALESPTISLETPTYSTPPSSYEVGSCPS